MKNKIMNNMKDICEMLNILSIEAIPKGHLWEEWDRAWRAKKIHDILLDELFVLGAEYACMKG